MLSDRRGAIAIWFALGALLLLVLVVGAIDVSRILSTRTRLQDALDAATLSVARMGQMDDDDVDTAGDKALAAVFRDRSATILGSAFVNSPGNAVTGTAEVSFTPLITDLVFKNGMKLAAESTVKRGQQAPVELVLVLDTTLSMKGAKLTALQAAAKKMVVNMTPEGVTSVKIGVVPFERYVNVGISRRNLPWMDTPADVTTTTPKTCKTVTTETKCQTEKYACTKYSDGVPYASECSRSINCVTTSIPPKEVCSGPNTSTSKFNGCAGSPAYPKNVTDNDATRRYPGIMNVTCAPELTPLTSDAKVVTAAITALKASGDTYIPGGLAWGFNLLSPAVPFTEAGAYDSSGRNQAPRKALVLMTDGANSMYAKFPGGTHLAVAGGTIPTQANTYTSELCVNIKAEKIELFTVAFQVTDPTIKAILKGCASDASHYFDATDATKLDAAFKDIADQLRQIYISR